MNKKIKLFITGHSGMLAKSIIDKLDLNLYELIYFDDLANYSNQFHYLRKKLIKEKEIDITNTKILDKISNYLDKNSIIIHTAAYVNTDKCDAFIYEAIKSNVLGTQNLINIVKKVGCKIINFSTTAIYDPDEYNKNNGIFVESDKIDPKTTYGLTKYNAELVVKQSLNKFEHITIKPVFIYGDIPFDNSSMIRKIIEKVYLGNKIKKLDVLLDPFINKDYMRYEYFADMFIHLLNAAIIDKNIWGNDYIISRDDPKQFDFYLNTICKVMEIDKNYLYKFINIIPNKDYLGNHNGISKNFYKKFPDFKLNKNVKNDYEGIKKTYISIKRFYEKDY
ncbi:MAG: NAD-dependent epimerase/dehydratase family protein [Candidatus Cloacimonetes bacterium]|nr:NAD-dependent epimerase/dehydratase family protein [Actinomycetota bacterium]MBL7085696.1 NAD-dependent epimerase/dehydratase family protein [Candidatus Cloacimonadota bacterium]